MHTNNSMYYCTKEIKRVLNGLSILIFMVYTHLFKKVSNSNKVFVLRTLLPLLAY